MQVVTAAVIRRFGAVLIARRKAAGGAAGPWELPGGKVEPGENERTCLARELREELAIEAAIGGFVAAAEFEHNGKAHRLQAYEAEWTGGRMELREHDEVRWIAPADADRYDMAASDRAIIDALRGRGSPGRGCM